MIQFRNILAATAIIAASMSQLPLSAQNEFDLSSQRTETPGIEPVTGHYIPGRTVVVNPTPQMLTISDGQTLNISKGFALSKGALPYKSDLDFLRINPKGVKLDIVCSSSAADKAGVKDLPGAYSLKIDNKGVTVIARGDTGAFYALQSLRQIVDNASGDQLPQLTINDWPDLPHRGVVEGFYGNPWSHQVRLSLIDFYGRNKMNTYLYGPKDDPYHSTPNWRLPYPPAEEQNIRELVDACKRNRVDFVWAIHPGKDIKWNEEDYNNLVNKFNMMYDLGVRSFAIFFDDIEGEGTNPERQVELLNRLTEDFIKTKGDVTNLAMCPTDYSRLWANSTPEGSLATYGRSLDKAVEVMNTGDVVCSDLTREGQEFFSNLTQRPGYYWWNFPVTDYGRMYLMQGPAYGLDTTLTSDDIVAIVSNPMEHGEASKLALYGVADYGWNPSAYNALDNWERGLRYLAPNAHEAYRRFAIHSCDTETGYRRDESWETPAITLDRPYAPQLYKNLYNEFDAITKVPAQLEDSLDNKLLLSELRPWLVEFGKLGQRGKRAIELSEMIKEGNDSTFWAEFTANIMTPEQIADYEAHKSGTLKLQPFYENAMNSMMKAFYYRLTGNATPAKSAIGSFSTLRGNNSRYMFDNDTTTYYHSGTAQNEKSWIGVDLKEIIPIESINILQGRNSVNDVDFFDLALLESSVDGESWKVLSDTLVNCYDISWTPAGTPVEARYVRLRRLPESKRKNWGAVRIFDVNRLTPEKLGFSLKASNPAIAVRAFDGDIATPYPLSSSLSFSTLPEMSTYIILSSLKPNGSFTAEFADAEGNSLGSRVINTPYSSLELPENAAKVTLTGSAVIYEILPRP